LIQVRARIQKARHRTATRADQKDVGKKRFGKTVWSALQTHLQGVTRAMLAIMPEKRRHRTALLS
jgi:hypothetical protein